MAYIQLTLNKLKLLIVYLSLPIISKSLYINDVVDNSDMQQSNKMQFKQILIDLDNYNALKELGKAGDSFNNVIRALLNKTESTSHPSSVDSSFENMIEINPDNKSFILKVDSGLRQVGVNRIIGFKDHLEIDYLDESSVNVVYSKDLLEIPREVESALLNSNLRLPNYAVKRIVEYFEEHEYKIEVGISKIT